jgi:hypothetical protein
LNPATKYYWRVRSFATTGEYSLWTSYRAVLIKYVPPVLLGPANLAIVTSLKPTFEWNAVPDATGYQIQISTSNSFGTLVVDANAALPTFTPGTDLASGTTYYWRVRALGSFGPGDWSQARKFTTDKSPSAPSLIAPANTALVPGPSPLFDWEDSNLPAGVTFDHYQIQVAMDNAFANIVHDHNITGISNSQDKTAVLTPGTTYYWHVRSFAQNGVYSAWSSVFSVRIKHPAPTLLGPARLSTVDSLKPTFTWSTVVGATGYQIQVSESRSFLDLVVNRNVLSPVFIPIKNLNAKTTYYWRVRVTGTYGSNWSAVFKFTTP